MLPALPCMLVAVVVPLAALAPARAQDAVAAPPVPFISEIRGGLMYHEDSRLRRLFFNQDKQREDGIIDVD